MTSSEFLDAAGRRRSPATMPGFHCGRPPRNKGRSYPADPPTVEEIVAVMRRAGDRTAWAAHPSADRAALARRAADQRGAVARRERPRPGPWQHPHPPRQGRPAPPGRHGRLGMGPSQPVARGSNGAARRRSALCGGWADGRATLVGNRGSGHPAPSGSVRWRSPSLRSASICRPHRYADQTRRGAAKRQLSGPKHRHNPAPFRSPLGRRCVATPSPLAAVDRPDRRIGPH